MMCDDQHDLDFGENDYHDCDISWSLRPCRKKISSVIKIKISVERDRHQTTTDICDFIFHEP